MQRPYLTVGFWAALLLLLAVQIAHAQEVTVRYYMTKVRAPTEDKPFYRVAIADAIPGPEAIHTDIPADPETGIPLFTHALAAVEATDWSGIDADPDNLRLDAGKIADQGSAKDLLIQFGATRWGQLTGAQRTKLRTAIHALGIPTADIDDQVSLRAILNRVGRYWNPTFDETKLGIQ